METVAKARLLVTRFPFEPRLGGEEMHTIQLMKELDKKGYESFFLGSCPILHRLFKENGFESGKVWLGKPPVTMFSLLSFTVLFPVLFGLAGYYLWTARKRWKVGTLYSLSLGEKLLMTPWAKLFGMKVIWLEHARIGSWLRKNPWRVLYSFFSRLATTVVTSDAMLPFVKKYAKHVVSVPCGVILEKPAPLLADIKKFLRGGFAIGTVARLTVDKGVDMIVRLVHSKPDVRLVIVGEGPLESKVRKVAEKGRILLLPSLPRQQLMSLYEALDLFILGSAEMDPFGMVAAEAMWFGTPALITDKCGITQHLTHGKDAYIVPARVAELDKAVKKLMKNEGLLEKLGKAGQSYVKTHHRLSQMVGRFEDILRA